MLKKTMLVAMTLAGLGGHLSASAGGYAEAIYGEYSAATGGAIKFELATRQAGSLAELKGRPLSDFLGVPSYVLQADNAALELKGLTLAPVDLKSIHLTDLAASVDGFSKAGFPVDTGAYRLLDVSFEADKAQRRHAAIEVCFVAQAHCVVFDPSIEFIDSEVNSIRAARASGWAVAEHSEANETKSIIPGEQLKARCGLASNPATTGRWWTQAGHTYTWKNLFGITMVSKSIGGSQWGLRCDSSCRPQPFGYAHNSSAWANIPFSVQCDNETNGGTSSRSGKFVARTGCAHRTVLGAKFNATKSGVGIGVEVNINATGSVTQHGGSFQDRCAYF